MEYDRHSIGDWAQTFMSLHYITGKILYPLTKHGDLQHTSTERPKLYVPMYSGEKAMFLSIWWGSSTTIVTVHIQNVVVVFILQNWQIKYSFCHIMFSHLWLVWLSCVFVTIS